MPIEVPVKLKFDLSVIQKNSGLRAEVNAKIIELCPEKTDKERHDVITNYLELKYMDNPLGLTNLRISLPNNPLIREKENIPVKTSSENPTERRMNTNNSVNLIRANELDFDDFYEYTNAEDVVRHDIVRKFGRKAEKYLKQIEKYVRRFFETKIVNEDMIPDYIRFKDGIRTSDDLLARKREKQVADKSRSECNKEISSIQHKRYSETRNRGSTSTSEASFCTVISVPSGACRPKSTSKEVEENEKAESNRKENETTDKPSKQLPSPSSASSHPTETTAQINLSPDLFPSSHGSNKNTLQQANNQNTIDVIVQSSEEVEIITASEPNCNRQQITFCNANDIAMFSESFADPSLKDPLRITASQPVIDFSQMNISKMDISQESSVYSQFTETYKIEHESQTINVCSPAPTDIFDRLTISHPTPAAIQITSQIIKSEINNTLVADVGSNSNIMVTIPYLEVIRNCQKSEDERLMLDESHVMIAENSEISATLQNSDAMLSHQPINLQVSHAKATVESISGEMIASNNSTENPKLFREPRNAIDSLEENQLLPIDVNDWVNSIKQLTCDKSMNSFSPKDFTSVDLDQLREGQLEEEFLANHGNLQRSDLRQPLRNSDESQIVVTAEDDSEHADDFDKGSDEWESTILVEDDSERPVSDKTDKVNEKLPRNVYPRSQSSSDICQNPGNCDKTNTSVVIQGSSERTDSENASASLDKLKEVTIKEEFPKIAFDYGRNLDDSDIMFLPNESPEIIVIEHDPDTAEDLLAALMGNIFDSEDSFVLPPVAAINVQSQTADKVPEKSQMLEDEFDEGSMTVPSETDCIRKRHHSDETVNTEEIFPKVRRLSEKEPDCNIIIESEVEITDSNLSKIDEPTNPDNLKRLPESKELPSSSTSRIMKSTSISVRSTTKCSNPKSKPISNRKKINKIIQKKSKKLNKVTKKKENNKDLDDTIVPQVKHNFQPLKLVSRVKPTQTLKVPQKPVSKPASIDERLQTETTLDLENLIEDPSQDDIVLPPSPPKLTTSQILSREESFFLNIQTPEKSKQSNQAVLEEEDQSMEYDLENQEVSSQHEVDLPKLAIINKQVEILNCFPWITTLYLNSFLNCRIFSVSYESSIPFVNPCGGINMKAKFLFQEIDVSIEIVGEKNIKFQLVAANCGDFSIKLIKAIEAWRTSLNVEIYSLCEIVVIRALCYLFRQFQKFQLVDIKQIVSYEDYVMTNCILKKFHKTVSCLSKFFDSETMELLNL